MVNDVGSSIADAQYYCVQDFQVVCDPLFISEVKIKDTTIIIHQKNVVCSNCMYSWKGQERTNPGIHRIWILFVRLEKMAEIEFGGHTVRSHGAKVAKKHKYDWLILLVLAAMDGFLNFIEPFNRYTNSKMLEDLKFPFKEHDTIPMWGVPIFAVILPCIVILIYYYYRRDVYDLHHAILGLLYSVLVTAVITDSIKDAVGRPRPNFYYRCFPNGVEAFQANGDVKCHGDPKIIKEGYKSFPSGHTSWSFAGLAFLSWYLCGKVKAYDRRGHAAKLCIVLLPLLFAALVGISRVDDYWHHWTDVFTGSIIGTVVASLCYLLFFPFPHDINGWAPHASIKTREKNECQSSSIAMATV